MIEPGGGPRSPRAAPARAGLTVAAALLVLLGAPSSGAAGPDPVAPPPAADEPPDVPDAPPPGDVPAGEDGDDAAVAGPIGLRLKTAAPRSSPWGELLTNLGSRVKRATDGRVAVRIYWSQKSEATLVRQCQKGRTDGIAVSLGALASAVPELDAVELPFLFDGYEEADRAMTRAAPLIAELLLQQGFVYVLRGENGFRHFATRGGFVTSPEALAGRVMRSQPSKLHEAMWRAFGAEPKPLQVADVPDSLKGGVVAGYDNTLLFGQLAKWSEHITHVTLSAHVYQAVVVVWCKPWLDALPLKLAPLVTARDPKLEASGLKLVRVFNDKLMPAQYAAQGKQLQALSEAERATFAARAAGVSEAFAAATTPAGRALLEALRKR